MNTELTEEMEKDLRKHLAENHTRGTSPKHIQQCVSRRIDTVPNQKSTSAVITCRFIIKGIDEGWLVPGECNGDFKLKDKE